MQNMQKPSYSHTAMPMAESVWQVLGRCAHAILGLTPP